MGECRIWWQAVSQITCLWNLLVDCNGTKYARFHICVTASQFKPMKLSEVIPLSSQGYRAMCVGFYMPIYTELKKLVLAILCWCLYAQARTQSGPHDAIGQDLSWPKIW